MQSLQETAHTHHDGVEGGNDSTPQQIHGEETVEEKRQANNQSRQAPKAGQVALSQVGYGCHDVRNEKAETTKTREDNAMAQPEEGQHGQHQPTDEDPTEPTQDQDSLPLDVQPLPSLSRRLMTTATDTTTNQSQPGAISVPGISSPSHRRPLASLGPASSLLYGSDVSDNDGSEQRNHHHEEVAFDASLAPSDDDNPRRMEPSEQLTCSEVIEGAILDERQRRRRHPNKLMSWILLFGLVGIAAIILTVVLLIIRSDHEDGPGVTTERNGYNSSAIEPVYPPFRDDLLPYYTKGIQDVNSAFYQANLWMLNDPFLERYPTWQQRQRFDMAIFYYATQGHNWIHNDHWLSYDVPECQWWSHHVSSEEYPSICDEDGYLLIGNWSYNNLQSEALPNSYYALLRTHTLDIGHNNISGKLPAGDNPNLLYYSISNNRFEGMQVQSGKQFGLQLPYRSLKLDGNLLIGNYGVVFLLLPYLEVANFSSNFHDGQLPRHAAASRNLTYLGFADNLFTGTLPPQWGVLSKLKELDLSRIEQLTGTIPHEWHGMESLQKLDLRGTVLEGNVPLALCERQAQGLLDILVDCGAGSLISCCSVTST